MYKVSDMGYAEVTGPATIGTPCLPVLRNVVDVGTSTKSPHISLYYNKLWIVGLASPISITFIDGSPNLTIYTRNHRPELIT